MTTTATDRSRNFSDRAHRILFELAMHPDGEWVGVTSIYTSLGLNSHEVRGALTELRNAGMAERKRRYVRDEKTGRRTHRTYFRLTDTTSEASA
ncbi:Rrf2 family transcriptional regulator [Streptomyces ferrugineus]|uniref:Rrf2 family transcriptional regulator n=1 Tax=Streptomyces ferrugineus TaxID=1413221 RepID=A0A7M2SWV5_9ACTN|nr:Rrf2 family transcriptional regulator [Streptomyces ferrugineus]QOV40135.1 Rrf2 family transcriptional regulator [Streptomyces ferrugineus]